MRHGHKDNSKNDGHILHSGPPRSRIATLQHIPRKMQYLRMECDSLTRVNEQNQSDLSKAAKEKTNLRQEVEVEIKDKMKLVAELRAR